MWFVILDCVGANHEEEGIVSQSLVSTLPNKEISTLTTNIFVFWSMTESFVVFSTRKNSNIFLLLEFISSNVLPLKADTVDVTIYTISYCIGYNILLILKQIST